ncbi:R-spondin-4 [Eublepharis macularius]|uniref:R-spondin-2 n=1 Tax=Eublepharis macularius TaxID=481883 RepID=A0AA97JIP6_EUBMA|nr:R-spondin-4 [Eublepharis macularius]
MQWIIFLLLLFINSMEMLTQARRKKRVSATLFENCTGCVMCSEDNGCIACQQRLFLLIWRDGIRQYGACVHACPPGYFGVRGQELNRCIKCRSPSCESCFSKDFCMKCKEHFFLHKGKCFSACPPETLAQSSTRECQEKCEMGPWSNWSPCTNQGKTCGFKWGSATRVREVIRSSKEESAMCSTLSESRKCRMKKHCPGEKNEKKRKGKRDKKEKKKKRKIDSLMVT